LAIYRAESVTIGYGTEATFGADPGTANLTFLPGVYETITLPDPEFDWQPHWLLGDASNRNWHILYRGRRTHSMSIPDFVVISGTPFKWPIGTVATTGSDDGTGNSTLNGAVARGVTTIVLTSGTGYANTEFIQIGTGATAEVRQISSGGGTATLVLNYPLSFAHANLEACNEVIAPFTHTISESDVLDTFTLHSTYNDSDSTAANRLMRRHLGGKMSRATFITDEGEPLRMSWDEVLFQDIIHNQQLHSAITGNISKYSATVAHPTVTIPTTEPYYFSEGTLTMFGVAFARLRSMRLEIMNNIEPHYYISDNSGAGQIPQELQEQRKEYRLSASISLPDSFAATATTRSLFKELLVEVSRTSDSDMV